MRSGRTLSVSEHVWELSEERIKVILLVVGKVVIEICTSHIKWCALLFSVLVDGAALILAKTHAAALEDYTAW